MDSVEKPVERPPLIQYWHDAEIPDEIGELLQQAGDRNRDLRHLVFDEHAAAALIAEHFTAREEAAFRACAAPTMQANYLRYCGVYALGGVYCDVDVVVSGSFSSLLDADAAFFHGAKTTLEFPANLSERDILSNHVFGCGVAGHPLLGLAIELATAGIEARIESIPASTGLVFTMMATIFRLGSFDALLDLVAAGALASPLPEREQWLDFLQSVRPLVGDHARVAAAFDGVRISSIESLAEILSPATQLQYKQTENYWAKWESSLYR